MFVNHLFTIILCKALKHGKFGSHGLSIPASRLQSEFEGLHFPSVIPQLINVTRGGMASLEKCHPRMSLFNH